MSHHTKYLIYTVIQFAYTVCWLCTVEKYCIAYRAEQMIEKVVFQYVAFQYQGTGCNVVYGTML